MTKKKPFTIMNKKENKQVTILQPATLLGDESTLDAFLATL